MEEMAVLRSELSKQQTLAEERKLQLEKIENQYVKDQNDQKQKQVLLQSQCNDLIAYAGKTEVSVTNYDHVRDWIGAVIILGFFRVSAHLTDQRMLKNRGDKYQHVMDTVSPLIPFPTWLP